jgi:hypothetical protein
MHAFTKLATTVAAVLTLASAASAAESPKARARQPAPEYATKAYADAAGGYVKYGLSAEHTLTGDAQPLPGLSPIEFLDEGTLLKGDCWIVVRRSGGDSSATLTFSLTGSGSLVEAELGSNRRDSAHQGELGKGGLTIDAPDRNSTKVYHLTVDALTAAKPGTVILSLSKRNSDVYTVLPVSRCQWSMK